MKLRLGIKLCLGCAALAYCAEFAGVICSQSPEADSSRDPVQVIEELEALGRNSTSALGGPFFLHGLPPRPHALMRELATQRQEATKPICDALDRLGGLTREGGGFADALCAVLAFTKDAQMIPWLRSQLDRGDPHGYARRIVRRWGVDLKGIAYERVAWLDSPELWSQFLWEQVDRHSTGVLGRESALKVMVSWLHDASTLGRMLELSMDSRARPTFRMLAMLYLSLHGHRVDDEKLTETVAAFAAERGAAGDDLFPEIARLIRHKAFIPHLLGSIETGSPSWRTDRCNLALQAITYQVDLEALDEWTGWLDANGGGSRHVWLADALETFFELYEHRPGEAGKFLRRAIYRWNDPALIPWMGRVIADPGFRPIVADWVTLSRTPFLQEEFCGLADEVLVEGAGRLDVVRKLALHAASCTDGRGSWEEFVGGHF